MKRLSCEGGTQENRAADPVKGISFLFPMRTLLSFPLAVTATLSRCQHASTKTAFQNKFQFSVS